MASLEHQYAFSAGMIRRVKLHNFLTYRDVELHAGPRHNLVLGPNGTGKSSLLCAIGLGLGGRPKILGRADDLGTFILYGESRAHIEVALQDTQPGRYFAVRREFESASKRASKWYIREGSVEELRLPVRLRNQKWLPSNEKAVSEKVRALGVDVNNLSCFMPQERVGEFSGIDPVPLLRNTLSVLQDSAKGSARPILTEHERLIEVERDIANMAVEGSTAQRELDKLRVEAETLEREVQRQQERIDLEAEVDVHEKLLRWKHFERLCAEGRDVKQTLEQLEVDEARERERVEPLKNEVDKLDIKRGQLVTKKKKVENKKARLELQYKELLRDVEDTDTKVAVVQQKITHLDSDRARDLAKVAKLEERISAIDAEIRAIDIAALRAGLEKAEGDAASRNKEALDLSDKSDALRNDFDEKKREADHVKRNLTEIQNYQRRIVSNMRSRYGARGQVATDAFKLIEEMRAQKLFRGEVHGPVISTIHAPNTLYASAIEDYLGRNGGCAFVTSDRQDYDLINKRMAERRLRIILSNVDMSRGDTSGVSHENVRRMKEEADVQVRGDEAFEAPALVKQYLRAFNAIERMVIGTSTTEQRIDDLLRNHVPSSAKSLVVYTLAEGGQQLRKHEGSWSNEGRSMLNTTGDCYHAKLLNAQGDDREAALQHAYDSLRAQLEGLRERITDLNEQATIATDAQKTLHAQVSGFKSKLKEPVTKGQKKAACENQLATLQARVASDSSAARAALVAELSELCSMLCQGMEGLQETLGEMAELHVPVLHADLMAKAVEELLQERRGELAAAMAAPNEIAKRRADTKDRLKKVRKEAKRTKKDLEQHAPILERYTDEAGNVAERDTPLRAKLTQLENFLAEGGQEVTIDIVEDALQEKREALGAIQANNQVFDQHAAAMAAYEACLAQRSARDSINNERQSKLEEHRDRHRSEVKGLLNTISNNFSTYMNELLFSGCGVILAEHEGPVETWELHIRVKFRDNSDVQTLSAHVHSGGERAVSTIMFLMALQQITPSPFRIVDEINQGMDERNERLVMRRIIKNTTGATGKQYFLITPKLLEGLTDMEDEDVVVHVVVNGRKNVRSADWNLNEFCAKRRRIAV